MTTENSIALKEWAAVCLALAEGRQSLLLRKGGIAEGSGGFRMEHPEFWLFPTQFHQSPDQLSPEGSELLSRVQQQAPAAGRLRIDAFATIRSVAFIDDEKRLSEFDGRHVMSTDVVRERFHYRRPGLFVAAVEVHRRSDPVEIPDEPRYAGCHSWVDLSSPISTAELSPVVPVRALAESIALVESFRR
ncbi:hypothetical protein Pan44_06710 [Caulifigura coniformis]|uniref:DUF1802 family protein n=1 Tax=Caulifigura coniformis TaxID=2527983 RepID=A0A517S966_9PLAN|nr:DUF1802 family protein [Caulifigura coniformis]QDT52659.1 hypothetical protein Pan44_06710 [Caulifigura coniformis]